MAIEKKNCSINFNAIHNYPLASISHQEKILCIVSNGITAGATKTEKEKQEEKIDFPCRHAAMNNRRECHSRRLINCCGS